MEQRAPSYLSAAYAGKMVPAESHQLPLLPYERHLIQILGISEQEYQFFAEEVKQKFAKHRIEYEHIPDIRCEPVTVALVSLAVGAVLTAAAAALAPKPRQLTSRQEQDQIEQRQLPSVQGRTKFNNSIGFDAAPSLAQLGARIPIPFGRYFEIDETQLGDDAVQRPSGGILVEPLLVWSRMTSHGTYQTLKALAVIGQAAIETTPDLQGILIGGQPIANFYKSNYAVFYKSTLGDNRLYLSDLKYGDAAEGSNAAYGIFTCPTATGVLEPGFSMALSPANTTSFGVYQTIPNGGHFRVNWRVISIPALDGQIESKYDPSGRLKNDRRKVAGMNADGYFDEAEGGMPGIGRSYSVKMGVTKVNNASYTLPTLVSIARDDVITFTIDGGQYDVSNTNIDSNSGINVDDINSAANEMRSRADELLQIGEIFMINRAMFRVTERPSDLWDKNRTQDYKLKCINFTGANREIGVIGFQNIQSYVLSEGGDSPPQPSFKGSGYYPLHKVDLGQVRNTRATEVTEIGIKSKVYAQANGLCNFNAIPSVNVLNEYDGNGISLTNPTINSYLKRTSFFMLAVKNVGDVQGLTTGGEEVSDSDDLMEGFDILGDTTFAITGNSPIDKYNYIRIKCPERAEYEFRLVPKCSTNIFRYESGQNQNIYSLEASGSLKTATAVSPHYGTFQLSFNAHVKSLNSLFDLEELRVGQRNEAIDVNCTATGMSHVGTVGASGGGWWQGFLETILGNLKPTPGNGSKALFDERRSRQFTFSNKGITVTLEITGTVKFMGESWKARNGTAKAWDVNAFRIVSISGALEENMTLDASRSLSNTWYSYYYSRIGSTSTQRFRVTGVTCDQGSAAQYAREFEDKAQIKEISAYAELTRSCDNAPEHEIVYVNESSDVDTVDGEETGVVPNYYGLSMIGIKLRSMNRIQSFQQLQVWMPNGISVERLNGGGTGPSNNFADLAYWLLTQEGRAVGQEVSDRLIDRESFVATAKFIDNYWMNFDGAITTQVNLRSYLTQLAPLFLCNFVIKNGKFALVPALPVDSAGVIIQGTVPITTIFTDGNIIENSFELDYLDQSEREDFRAVMKYRRTQKNSLVTEESLLVRWNEEATIPPKQEVFDMSNYCTRRSHAFAAARYMLSVRRRVDHVVRFQTTPSGLSLAPGDYIRVETAAAPYNSLYNGVVRDDGTIVTPITLDNNTYATYVYRQGADSVTEEQVTVENNTVSDSSLAGALINIPTIARRFGVYMVEEISVNEDGLVDITASHFPVFEDQTSKIVNDVLTPANFAVVE